MSVHITNVSSGLVSVELNSGDTIHLAPGETSPTVEDYQVGENGWIRLLAERGRITVHDAPAAETSLSGRRRHRETDSDSPTS